MIEHLDSVEVRILGSLIEKEITTPEYYPLTLNALVNACNQKSNRDPVLNLDEETVADAVDTLRHRSLIGVLTGGSNRVPKYSHRLGETLNLGRRELPLLCELMLRGPQTVGELRDRAGRMHRFADTEEVEGCLRGLSEREPVALVKQLPRQPGRKEARYAHLLTGEPELGVEPAYERPGSATSADRLAVLEAEVGDLRKKVADLEQQWLNFKRQFE